MGDAADDVFDSGARVARDHELMRAAGCRPCPNRHKDGDDECPTCHDLGWLDAAGNPCEI